MVSLSMKFCQDYCIVVFFVRPNFLFFFYEKLLYGIQFMMLWFTKFSLEKIFGVCTLSGIKFTDIKSILV